MIKKTDNRKSAFRFLLTISQIGDFEKEKIREKLLEKYGKKIVYCCISKELHADKGIHCHIFIHFNPRLRYKYSPNTFEFLFDKVANIQVIKGSKENKIRSLQYVKKVQDYIEFGKSDFNDKDESFIKNVGKYVIKMLEEGIEYERLATHEIEKVRHYALQHSVSLKRVIFEIKEARSWIRNQSLKGIRLIDDDLMKKNLTAEEYDLLTNSDGLKLIVKHINQIMEYKCSRPFKTKNLLIWSNGVNKGKTSLIRKIMEHTPMYSFPRDNWFHGYKSNEFWGILWNEMTLLGIDVEMLKNFLEGSPVKLNIKGSSVEKIDNPEVIMTSNMDLRAMVHRKNGNTAMLNALEARVDEVNLDDYEDIFFLQKLIISSEYNLDRIV